MKKKLVLLAAGLNLMVCMKAQTLYVPSGTSGIGTSATGNVGIGTTNPSGLLQVGNSISDTGSPTVRISTAAGGSGTVVDALHIDTQNSGSYDQGVAISLGLEHSFYGAYTSRIVHYGYSSITRGSKLQLQTHSNIQGNWNTGILIDENGNVGIGTTDPQTFLNVNVGTGGSNGTSGVRVGGLGNYPSLELGIDGDYDGMIRSYGNNINYYAGHWQTKGATASENHSHNWFTSKAGSADWSVIKMVLNQDGNLGIGTTNPTQKLAIAGRLNFAAYSTSIDDFGLWVTTTEGTTVASAGATNIVFRTNNTEQMRIGKDGTVGIGTPTPNPLYKLDVAGSIRANEIKVNTTGADFVFEPTYKLRTLAEVETFINQHKHLPDVAPAAEMQTNGVSMGEMQAKLLQKVEELTLYSIEQNRKIQEQENTSKDLEKDLALSKKEGMFLKEEISLLQKQMKNLTESINQLKENK